MASTQVPGRQIKDSDITDTDIATANKDGTVGTPSLRTLGTGALQAAPGNDSRLSDARTPTAHSTSHKHGGSDEVATATSGANLIPKAGSGGTLAAGWIQEVIALSDLTDVTAKTGTGTVVAMQGLPTLTGLGVNGSVSANSGLTAQNLDRYLPANGFAYPTNMTLVAGTTAGTHTADGKYVFSDTTTSWAGGFLSATSYARVAGRVLEWVVDSTTGTDAAQTDNIMIGWGNGSLSGTNYFNITHAWYFAHTASSGANGSLLYIYEDNISRGSFVTWTWGAVLRLRIILKATGADYYYKINNGNWVLAYRGTYSTSTPLYPSIAPYANRYIVHSLQVYDNDQGDYLQWPLVIQASHGFVTGDVIYNTGSTWAKAKADSAVTLGQAIAVVVDSGNFYPYQSGFITGLSGLTAGQYYYVSATSAGAITATAPVYPYYDNPILYATSTTAGIVLALYRPIRSTSSSPANGKNALINGNFDVWQAGTSQANASGYLADMWNFSYTGTLRGTQAQVADAPTPSDTIPYSNYSWKITVTTTEGSLSAGDYAEIYQYIEGYNWQHFWQRQLSLSFWVKSSVTGTYCVSLRSSGVDRSYVATYTISVANTWEYKTILFPASPSGGTWGVTTGAGAALTFCLGTGSTYQGSAGSWQSANYIGTSAQTNLFATAAATWQITQVQLEAGPIATPYEIRQFTAELALCKRYYEILSDGMLGVGMNNATTAAQITIKYEVAKRIAPTITSGAAANFQAASAAGGGIACTVVTFNVIGTITANMPITVASGLVAGNANYVYLTNPAGAVVLDARM